MAVRTVGCYDYEVPNVRTVEAKSHIECYRKCLTHHYIKRWNCLQFFIDNLITEFDLIGLKTNRCSIDREDMRHKTNYKKIFSRKMFENMSTKMFSSRIIHDCNEIKF